MDGELDRAESDAVAAHVELCLRCTAKRRQLERLESCLKSALKARASRVGFEPFWRGVQQRIQEKRSWSTAVFGRVRAAFATPKLAWGVPAIIALVLGVLYLAPDLPGPAPEPRRPSFASVDSIDAHGFNVALFREAETKTTVIWLFRIQEDDNETSGETNPANSSL